MDGLTIRTAEGIIDTGRTTGEIRDSKLRQGIGGISEGSPKSFADTLQDAIGEVNKLQQTANQKMEDLATGKAKSIPDVMIATEKADIALKLMVQVRNKVIDAYNEIMKMQV